MYDFPKKWTWRSSHFTSHTLKNNFFKLALKKHCQKFTITDKFTILDNNKNCHFLLSSSIMNLSIFVLLTQAQNSVCLFVCLLLPFFSQKLLGFQSTSMQVKNYQWQGKNISVSRISNINWKENFLSYGKSSTKINTTNNCCNEYNFILNYAIYKNKLFIRFPGIT